MRILFWRRSTEETVLAAIEKHNRSGKGWGSKEAARLRAGIERLVIEGKIDALLRIAAGSGRGDFRDDAVLALGHLGDPAAVPKLIEFLADGRVRDAAVQALAAIGDERAIDPIVQTWCEGYFGPFEEALVQLAVHHRAVVLDAAIPLLRHEEWNARQNALYCLRSLRAQEAVPALVAAAEAETDRMHKALAVQMIQDIGGPSAEAALQKLVR